MKVTTINKTVNPQATVYMCLHQCYSATPVTEYLLTEKAAGEVAVKRLLAGGRAHLSPLEQISITFNCAGVPHSTVAQITRHRHVSFSVESFRYTAPVRGTDIEEIVYLRPIGIYKDRDGNNVEYTQEIRQKDLQIAQLLVDYYYTKIDDGFPPEQARGLLPYDLRQHFTCTFNARALMEFIELRHKADAQLEIRQLTEMFFQEFKIWVPEIATWFEKNKFRTK